MCEVLGVSRSGFYAWRNRSPSKRARKDQQLTERIRHYHKRSDGTYGAPRILADLREEGYRIGRKRVARLMRQAGLRGVTRRKAPQTTTPGEPAHHIPDLVDRDFTADQPNQLWVADITYVPTGSGWLYLAVVLDAYSRRIVGWAMGSTLETQLILWALSMAVTQREASGVIHHSDHGSQYTSLAFGIRCEEAAVRPSMGTVGDCYDNALCESFFASLECELIDRYQFTTHRDARQAIFQYIEGWYNPTRRHSGLGQISPVDFEQKYHNSTNQYEQSSM